VAAYEGGIIPAAAVMFNDVSLLAKIVGSGHRQIRTANAALSGMKRIRSPDAGRMKLRHLRDSDFVDSAAGDIYLPFSSGSHVPDYSST
jgi:hypothetical protein